MILESSKVNSLDIKTVYKIYKDLFHVLSSLIVSRTLKMGKHFKIKKDHIKKNSFLSLCLKLNKKHKTFKI